MRSQFFTNLSLGLKILPGIFITPAHCTIGERGFWSIEKSAKADVYVLLISSQVKKVQNIFCWLEEENSTWPLFLWSEAVHFIP